MPDRDALARVPEDGLRRPEKFPSPGPIGLAVLYEGVHA